jgi:hypothetical protein
VVLTATETHLMPYQFPTRTVPAAAGAAAGQLLVALPSSIEEWDPQSRMPKRRLRLPRAAVITAVGGSERLVWMTTQQEPARIDVIPLVNRGQPRAHDLPEPIASIVGHPRSDLVACIGARTGRLYLVDLDGRSRLRALQPPGIDWIESAALAQGRMSGVIVAQALHPVAILPLDSREADVAPDIAPLDEPPAPPAAPAPPAVAAAPDDVVAPSPVLDGPAAAAPLGLDHPGAVAPPMLDEAPGAALPAGAPEDPLISPSTSLATAPLPEEPALPAVSSESASATALLEDPTLSAATPPLPTAATPPLPSAATPPTPTAATPPTPTAATPPLPSSATPPTPT